MTITTTKNNGCLTLELEGRLDTTTAPELETVIKNGLEGMDSDCVWKGGFSGLVSVEREAACILL